MSKNVLQPLDVNRTSMDRSPVRKRARYDSPVKEGWSLTSHNLKLDEVFDFGVGVLNSDSETQTDDEECPRDASSYDDCLEPTAEPDEPAADSISLDDWDGFLIKKPVISNTSIGKFFSLRLNY